MPHALDTRRVLHAVAHFFEHALFIIIGLILMGIGLAFCMTIIMLPLGVVIGVAGLLTLIAGLLADFDSTNGVATNGPVNRHIMRP